MSEKNEHNIVDPIKKDVITNNEVGNQEIKFENDTMKINVPVNLNDEFIKGLEKAGIIVLTLFGIHCLSK